MKSIPHYFLLLTICYISACSNSTQLETTIEPMEFKKGNYRKEGKCIKLLQDNTDLTERCNAYIGVIATEDDRPRFTFSQQNGDFWAFSASGPATYSNGNRTAVYPISHIYQMSSKLIFLFEGECRLSLDEPYEDIHCSTWKDKNRSQEAWKASFVGNGRWRYLPN